MADLRDRFKSAKQDWETPDSLFNELNNEFNFTLDAAADSTNAKVRKYFTKEDNGLAKDWGSNTVFVNPPYGDGKANISKWVWKGFNAACLGATVVMLIPARTNTNWFHDYCLDYGEVRFVRGRPKFGGAKHGLPLPLCVVVFRPRLTEPTSKLISVRFGNDSR